MGKFVSGERTGTRKDEIRYHTADTSRMVGKFLAKRVTRSWTEDFLDQDSGEVVSIERTEVLFDGGSYIDNELAAEISFWIASGDVKEVEVSNQRRQAKELVCKNLYPYKVKARIGDKNYNFLVKAQDVIKAVEVAKDYIELNYKSDFIITAVNKLSAIIIDKQLTKYEGEAENEGLTVEIEGEEQQEKESCFLQVQAEVKKETRWSDGQTEELAGNYTFILRAKNVDSAKLIITAYLETINTNDGEQEEKIVDVVILTASAFSCSDVVDEAFCLAYKEE